MWRYTNNQSNRRIVTTKTIYYLQIAVNREKTQAGFPLFLPAPLLFFHAGLL